MSAQGVSEQPPLVWEVLNSHVHAPALPPGVELGSTLWSFRTKVPGGWLVAIQIDVNKGMAGLTFLPDPEHGWDGGSGA